MTDTPNIAQIATLMGDPARATILWTLIDGTRRPAGELAFAANISAQSASAHLAKLVEGGLLLSEAQGRHRYFRIASAEAAHLVESLASFGNALRPKKPPAPAAARAMPPQFLQARSCYDHLAGEIAVRLLEAMLGQGWLVSEGADYQLTALGRERLAALGVADDGAHKGRRPYARCCVDLTQRRPHLAGALGAALLQLYLKEAWVLRSPHSRVLSISPKGQAAFERLLNAS